MTPRSLAHIIGRCPDTRSPPGKPAARWGLFRVIQRPRREERHLGAQSVARPPRIALRQLAESLHAGQPIAGSSCSSNVIVTFGFVFNIPSMAFGGATP